MLAAAFFLMVYQYDNKYTAPGPKARDGILVLNSSSLVENPVIFLVDGWEYYSNILLTPEDFADSPPSPDQYMFIGRFGGFEKWNSGSPHGSASYRLNIQIPEQTDTYLLELPEIFSAYRLYINGRQMGQMGQPDPEQYRPETGSRSVIIEAGCNIEILFAVSDYSHLYSGMVYPPAFGQPEAVSRLLNGKLIFRSLMCAAVLTIGLLAIMVGMLTRKDILALMFGLLCLFFVGYAGYPLVRTLLIGFQVQYAIENISFCAMLCIINLISMRVGRIPEKQAIPIVAFGVLMCAASMTLHLLLPLGSLKLMLIYSRLITAYEWITAGFISFTVWSSVRKNSGMVYITPLLCGSVILLCALIMDRLLPVHEPILTGWFIELAIFVLVLCIGVMIGHEIAARYHENAVLTERANSMERLCKSQLSYFHNLKQEMERTRTMRHDLRHHIAIMNEYVQHRQYEELKSYMKGYQAAAIDGELADYCPIDIINVLTRHYHSLAKQAGIQLDIRCDLNAAADPGHTSMTDSDLCCLYSNLMENALEACLRIKTGRKAIRIAIFRIAPDVLNIHVRNTAQEVHPDKGWFLSSKKSGQTGYGLRSVKNIAGKYNGTAEFDWNPEEQEFHSKVTVSA